MYVRVFWRLETIRQHRPMLVLARTTPQRISTSAPFLLGPERTDWNRPKFADQLRVLSQIGFDVLPLFRRCRSEEHTSELQSLMRISYAVFCLKKNTPINSIY